MSWQSLQSSTQLVVEKAKHCLSSATAATACTCICWSKPDACGFWKNRMIIAMLPRCDAHSIAEHSTARHGTAQHSMAWHGNRMSCSQWLNTYTCAPTRLKTSIPEFADARRLAFLNHLQRLPGIPDLHRKVLWHVRQLLEGVVVPIIHKSNQQHLNQPECGRCKVPTASLHTVTTHVCSTGLGHGHVARDVMIRSVTGDKALTAELDGRIPSTGHVE